MKCDIFEYLVCQYKYPEPPGGEPPIFYRVSSQRRKEGGGARGLEYNSASFSFRRVEYIGEKTLIVFTYASICLAESFSKSWFKMLIILILTFVGIIALICESDCYMSHQLKICNSY